MNEFIEALRRKKSEKTLTEWAEELGISISVLSRILGGQTGMSTDVLRCFLRAYPDLYPLWLNADRADEVSIDAAA